jgi:hypothetical protein
VGSSLRLDKSQINISIRYGSEGPKKQKTIGRWPTGNQYSSYDLPAAEIKMSHTNNILSGVVRAVEDLYLREIQITMKIKNRQKSPFLSCGTYRGSPALTISDQKETIRFKRNKKMRQVITFDANTSRHTIRINWQFNCFLPLGKELHLDPILITEKETGLQPAPGVRETKKKPRTSWIATGTHNQILRLKYIEDNLSWMEQQRIFFDILRLDGIHGCLGDWENLQTEFKGKIGFLNRRIGHNGMIPGISFAPFYGEPGSELVRLHPDWLVGDLKGDALLLSQYQNKKVHILDFTQSAVQDYLKSTLDLFNNQWGFKAFHLLGLSSLLLPGRRYNNEKETGETLHEALSFFRETLGSKAFISTEELPLITQENQLSMMSFNSDMSSRRKSKKEIPELLYRILDHTYISHYPWLLNPGSYPLPDSKEIHPPQAGESLRQMMLINGGFLTITNDLPAMTPEQTEELKNLIPSFKRFTGGSLHLLNSPDKKKPCVVFNSNGYLGVFNLSSKKKQISLNMEEMKQKIYNKIGGAQIREGRMGMKTGELELILPPFGSRIFKF